MVVYIKKYFLLIYSLLQIYAQITFFAEPPALMQEAAVYSF